MGLTFLIAVVITGWFSFPVWLVLQDKTKAVGILFMVWIALTLTILFEAIKLMKEIPL